MNVNTILDIVNNKIQTAIIFVELHFELIQIT